MRQRSDALDATEARLAALATEAASVERAATDAAAADGVAKASLEAEVAALETRVAALAADVAAAAADGDAARRSAAKALRNARAQAAEAEAAVAAGKAAYVALQQRHDALAAAAEARAAADADARAAAVANDATCEALRAKTLEDEAAVVAAREGTKKALAARLAEYRALERQRREMYNAIQEAKGNLRVYCRLKPFLSGEAADNVNVSRVDDMTLHVADPNTMREQDYEFDFVIGQQATQEEIFEEVRPLATSVLDGYNVCIFAYGQTGSGKTYTMEGPSHDRGVSYRAVRELFTVAGQRGGEYTFQMRVSILEVYNNVVYDLQAARAPSKVRWGGDDVGVVIEPLAKNEVSSQDDVQRLLDAAYTHRRVAGTDCNAHSSRSHAVLTVWVDAHNAVANTTVRGKLHLIDLAGSERVKHSMAEGERLKEATHINTSLTHLKTVIQALASKSGFVAYRNSQLTSLLQDSLGGNCKCLMFANVSALDSNIPESICTLKYAAEARRVEVGKATANVKKN